MAGFRNIAQWANSATTGKNWISSFRKVPAVATIAGQWFDFSTAAGNPVPNYYASSPLTAATLDTDKGIIHGSNVSPDKKYIQRITFMNSGAATTANLPVYFLDYLLYYPFIDMDAAGEDQILDNTVTLPRHTSGAGVKMMLVAQAATIGGGQFTVTYTNQDGVAGRVTPNHFCAAAQNTGALVSSITAAAGITPFLALQSGDTGVQSVQSINFSVANGGLAALVLVKPLQTLQSFENSGQPVERENVRQNSSPPEIQDGAFLSFIGQTTGGTVAAGVFAGTLETVWG